MTAPIDAECHDQAVAFDILQHHIKALDQLLQNMADIDDMMDDLDDAAKKAGDDNRDAKAHRQARAYKLTQIVLTAAMQQHQLIEEQMAAFLASAPKLAEPIYELAERRTQPWYIDRAALDMGHASESVDSSIYYAEVSGWLVGAGEPPKSVAVTADGVRYWRSAG